MYKQKSKASYSGTDGLLENLEDSLVSHSQPPSANGRSCFTSDHTVHVCVCVCVCVWGGGGGGVVDMVVDERFTECSIPV